VHDPRHQAIGCPECFDEFQRNQDWWKARLEVREWSGSSWPVTTYRRSSSSGTTWLARLGVGILGFKHPAPKASATWEQRFGRLFETLQAGDVLVVVSALGQTSDEVARTIRTLRRHTSWSRCRATGRRTWRMHEADRR
jgi:hypothetical protein